VNYNKGSTIEKLLKKYLKKTHPWADIYIDSFNVDGANCEVKFYTDESKYEQEQTNVNIWDMLVFLHQS